MPYAADYAASKAAVLGLTRVVAREVGKDNIRVNSVAPSMVYTESAKEFLGEKAERGFEVISKSQILQKTLEVDDIYGTVLYLASDQSKFVTGQTLMVDGGSVLL
jgi:NAD(P)-dependent dehydrogenase (short-subunit alcohol dehydrogenase family)